jgi:hypothetical protein
MDIRSISPEFFTNALPEGVDIIIASPPMLLQHLPKSNRGNTLPGKGAQQCLAQLINYLNETELGGVGFIWSTTELQPPSPHVIFLLGEESLVEARKGGSSAYRNTRV